VVTSDTVLFQNDNTNNPRQYDYFYPFTLTTGNISFLDTNGVTRTLTGIAVNTVVPIPMMRVNATGTTATMLALIPKAY
jgi:hypothetical protein